MPDKMTALKVLSTYFNQGENKKPLREFSQELKALSDDEKRELAEAAAIALGVELA